MGSRLLGMRHFETFCDVQTALLQNDPIDCRKQTMCTMSVSLGVALVRRERRSPRSCNAALGVPLNARSDLDRNRSTRNQISGEGQRARSRDSGMHRRGDQALLELSHDVLHVFAAVGLPVSQEVQI